MDTQPLITVYLPTYNRHELVRRAILSVVAQTLTDFELIVVDDSEDFNSENVLRDLCDNDSRIKLIRNARVKGACGARNTAIALAQGKYITGLDDDDLLSKDHLQRLYRAWTRKPSNVIAIAPKQRSIKGSSGINFRILKYINYRHLLVGNFVGNQIFTETAILKRAGGFDESMPAWQDLECWMRLLKLGSCMKLKEATYLYDVEHGQERISDAFEERVIRAKELLVEKHNLNKSEEKLISYQLQGYKARSSKTPLFNIWYRVKQIFFLILSRWL